MDELRPAILELLEPLVERQGEGVEHMLHVGVGRAVGRAALQRREVVFGSRLARFLGEPIAKHRLRLLRLAEIGVGDAEQLAARVVARQQRDGTQPAFGRGLDAPGGDEEVAEIVPGAGILRVERDGLAQRLLRFLGPSHRAQEDAEVAPAAGDARRELEEPPVGRERLLGVSRFKEHVAEIHVDAGLVGRDEAGALDEVDPFRVAPLRVPDHAEKLQGRCILRIVFNNLLVNILSFFYLAFAVHLDGQFQCIRD